jgi:hypothetical protein
VAIITVAELQLHLQQTVALNDFYADVAELSVELASGAVLSYCHRLTRPWYSTNAPAPVKLVALRLAARLFTNPQQRTSYAGPEGLNYSGGPVRLFTDDEREILNEFRGEDRTVGTIGLSLASWQKPVDEL